MLAAVAVALACSGGSLPPSTPQEQLRPAVRCLVNQARAQNGLGPLRGSRRLHQVAQAHADDMQARNVFEHGAFGDRLYDAGMGDRAAGEAMVAGCGSLATPAGAVVGLLASPSHRAILLDPEFRRLAIAVATWAPFPDCQGPGTYVLDLIGPPS